MTFEELETYFSKINCGAYDRDNYDKYLKASKFSFNIPSIHITGTNGKGSTANYLYNIYLKAGYKVGLYNSPYLNTVDEMISINGEHIDKNDYLEIFNEYKNELNLVDTSNVLKNANIKIEFLEPYVFNVTTPAGTFYFSLPA